MVVGPIIVKAIRVQGNISRKISSVGIGKCIKVDKNVKLKYKP